MTTVQLKVFLRLKGGARISRTMNIVHSEIKGFLTIIGRFYQAIHMLKLLRIIDLVQAHKFLPQSLVRYLLMLRPGPELPHFPVHSPLVLILAALRHFLSQVQLLHNFVEHFLAFWALGQLFLGNADNSRKLGIKAERPCDFLPHLLLPVQAALNRLANASLFLNKLFGVKVTQPENATFSLIRLIYLNLLEDPISGLATDQPIDFLMVHVAWQPRLLLHLVLNRHRSHRALLLVMRLLDDLHALPADHIVLVCRNLGHFRYLLHFVNAVRLLPKHVQGLDRGVPPCCVVTQRLVVRL